MQTPTRVNTAGDASAQRKQENAQGEDGALRERGQERASSTQGPRARKAGRCGVMTRLLRGARNEPAGGLEHASLRPLTWPHLGARVSRRL